MTDKQEMLICSLCGKVISTEHDHLIDLKMRCLTNEILLRCPHCLLYPPVRISRDCLKIEMVNKRKKNPPVIPKKKNKLQSVRKEDLGSLDRKKTSITEALS